MLNAPTLKEVKVKLWGPTVPGISDLSVPPSSSPSPFTFSASCDVLPQGGACSWPDQALFPGRISESPSRKKLFPEGPSPPFPKEFPPFTLSPVQPLTPSPKWSVILLPGFHLSSWEGSHRGGKILPLPILGV